LLKSWSKLLAMLIAEYSFPAFDDAGTASVVV